MGHLMMKNGVKTKTVQTQMVGCEIQKPLNFFTYSGMVHNIVVPLQKAAKFHLSFLYV